MRKFRQILHIYWHYLTCIKGMVFIVGAGITFLVFGLLDLTTSSSNHNGAYGFFIISLFLMLIFPFVTAGAVFRQLASSSQFSLAGDVIPLAFTSMFVLTLLVTFIPWLLLSCFGREIITGQIIWIFFGASLHLLITQLSLHRQAMQGYQFLPVLCIIFLPQLNVEKWYLLFVPAVTWPLLLLTCCGWAWSFIKIHQTRRLSVNNFCSSLNLDSLDREALRRHATSRWLQAKKSSQPGESVFYNMLMDNRVLLKRQILAIVVVPVFMAFFFLLLSGWNIDHDGPFNLRLILLISLFPAIMGPFNLAEIMPRSKLLWLKTGNSRNDIWKLVEGYIIRELACTLSLTALLAVTGFLSGVLSAIETSGYMLLVICCAPFFAYYPLYFRMGTALICNVMLIIGLFAASIALSLVIIFAMFRDIPGPVFVLSPFLLTLGIISRYATKQAFTGVDWLKIKPRRLPPARKTILKN